MHPRHDDYERLIAPIEEDLLRAAWSVCRNEDDAEEALQETLCTVWRKLGRIRRHPNPKALLLRIALNTAYDVLRRRIRERERQSRLAAQAPAAPRRPDQALASKERESAILRAMASLSRKQSVAVLMRLVQGAAYEDIAETLGCRAATARKHVERGRQRLRELLAPLHAEANGEAG